MIRMIQMMYTSLWALTAVWTLVDIAGPAYRVTIPSIIYVANQ